MTKWLSFKGNDFSEGLIETIDTKIEETGFKETKILYESDDDDDADLPPEDSEFIQVINDIKALSI